MHFNNHSTHTPFSPTSTDTPFSPTTADTPREEKSSANPRFVPFQPASTNGSMEMDIDMEGPITPEAASPPSFTFTHIPQTVLPQSEPQPRPQAPGPPPTTLTARRAAQDSAFRAKLRQMALPLAPLVQLTTGAVHPAFPGTLLGYWLLTDGELESLAHFYHQRTPSRWTPHYPCPVRWRSDLPLEEKRRRMGKFIGLRGCDTPTAAAAAAAAAVRVRSEAELEEDARRARAAAAEDDVWRRKFPWC